MIENFKFKNLSKSPVQQGRALKEELEYRKVNEDMPGKSFNEHSGTWSDTLAWRIISNNSLRRASRKNQLEEELSGERIILRKVLTLPFILTFVDIAIENVPAGYVMNLIF